MAAAKRISAAAMAVFSYRIRLSYKRAAALLWQGGCFLFFAADAVF